MDQNTTSYILPSIDSDFNKRFSYDLTENLEKWRRSKQKSLSNEYQDKILLSKVAR